MLCIEQFRKTVLLKCKVANSSFRVRFTQSLKCTRLCLFNIESPYPWSAPRTGKTVEGLDLGYYQVALVQAQFPKVDQFPLGPVKSGRNGEIIERLGDSEIDGLTHHLWTRLSRLICCSYVYVVSLYVGL